MKKLLTIAMLFSLLFVQCDTASPNKTGEKETDSSVNTAPRSSVIDSSINKRLMDFSFDFLGKIQATQPATENFFVSPLSLHIAMGMLLNGAKGATYDEMAEALHVKGMDISTLNQAYRQLLTTLPAADPKVKLLLANSIWYRNTFKVSDIYLSTLKNNFQSEATPLSFSQDDVNTINKWASDKTNGKIQKVLEEINDTDVLFLLNALYFKGDWSEKFDKANTRDANFTLQNGQKKKVKMMYRQDKYFYTSTAEFAAVRVPYGDSIYNLTLILPNNGSLQDALNSLNTTTWNQLQKNMQPTKVQLGLPRFQLSYTIRLNNTLNKMGIKKVFTNNAELQNINPDGDLFASFIKQDTYLGVDEEGTEAAAVTSIGVSVTSMPVIEQFVCDRPFGFIISEKNNGNILFAGRITNPDSK
ncbi:serpin family protein [Haoranjiania flava]|uniref:Serpin family protein n=1 Tax=Haoranjiania flava TaxID=1856322 RepID=A0AAE3LJ54_9BACT|nr:serpin family protein [Haoranjiania flava]MCU7693327.1 serpin family protein [Haoranjiania flava]